MRYQAIRTVMSIFVAVTLLSSCGKSEETPVASSAKPTPAVAASPKLSPTPVAKSQNEKSEPARSETSESMKAKKPEVKCSPSEPIKGNVGKHGKHYHTPESPTYGQVKAEACFKDIASAEKAGYQAVQSKTAK